MVTVLLQPQRGALAIASAPVVGAGTDDAPAVTIDDTTKDTKTSETVDQAFERLLTDSLSLKTVVVTGELTANKLIVTNSAHIKGTMQIDGHITAGPDSAGSVTVAKGEKLTRVLFEIAYEDAPHVVLTPHTFTDYRITEVTKGGFSVELRDSADEDTAFEWIAIGVGSDVVGGAVEPVQEQDSAEPDRQSLRERIFNLFSFRS